MAGHWPETNPAKHDQLDRDLGFENRWTDSLLEGFVSPSCFPTNASVSVDELL
jgi:hypothetical protein